MKKLLPTICIVFFVFLQQADLVAQHKITIEKAIQERKDQIGEIEQEIFYDLELLKKQDKLELYVPLAYKINRYPHGFSEVFETKDIKVKKVDFVAQYIVLLYKNGLDPDFDLKDPRNQIQWLSAIGETADLEEWRRKTDEHNSRIEKPIKLKSAYDRLLKHLDEEYVMMQKELYKKHLNRYSDLVELPKDKRDGLIQKFFIHFEK